MDKRLSDVSARRAPVDEVLRLEALYRDNYKGWSVAHFHERYRERHAGERSYTWVKSRLHEAGLVSKGKSRGTPRRRRERAAIPGLLLHQDGSTHEWVPGTAWDLIVTMDDATSEVYSGFFVEEEGTWSSLRGVRETLGKQGCSAASTRTGGSHYWHTPTAGGKVDRANPTQFGRTDGGARDRDDPVVLAGGAGPVGTLLRDGAGPAAAGAGRGGHRHDGGGDRSRATKSGQIYSDRVKTGGSQVPDLRES